MCEGGDDGHVCEPSREQPHKLVLGPPVDYFQVVDSLFPILPSSLSV